MVQVARGAPALRGCYNTRPARLGVTHALPKGGRGASRSRAAEFPVVL
jgi:hypothetical protein